ncbi:ATP-binding protein [Paracoccus sp. (in: a-proteobacteria)]|uniref:ATP-binding protein n=1 Tax=Paracoccus sp. TaxID=267 RepID=UPI0026E027B8|nr:ATP-binding protein [Paracoccus sp. (in: a-proteobacteria)]MDO5647750.1 ATP-binding protein [Paracoccus sp. (in: a-proteobacteria)]
MDPVRNPFAPGAGAQPPELAGRHGVIQSADFAIQRALMGRPARSQMLLGLRGVGKTVLLNRIETQASDAGHLTSFIEAREGEPLASLLFPAAQQIVRKLSVIETAKTAGLAAMRALRSFAKTFKISFGDISISVDPEPGVADSGNLELDLPELFLTIGQAAAAAGKAWTLLIDEVQYLKEPDLAALIVAIHRANQRNLPILFFGAGLPQVAALSGDAKSYAERLFEYPAIGALSPDAATDALRQPILDEGETITDDALARMVAETQGYPYFLQEWGFQAWNAAAQSPITAGDVDSATENALRRLDQGFFKVRFDRLTPKEREYVIAMARLGAGPYRSSDVADLMGETAQALGPRRASIISKGMIYSPGHGDIAFTVPLFEAFLTRNYL